MKDEISLIERFLYLRDTNLKLNQTHKYSMQTVIFTLNNDYNALDSMTFVSRYKPIPLMNVVIVLVFFFIIDYYVITSFVNIVSKNIYQSKVI